MNVDIEKHGDPAFNPRKGGTCYFRYRHLGTARATTQIILNKRIAKETRSVEYDLKEVAWWPTTRYGTPEPFGRFYGNHFPEMPGHDLNAAVVAAVLTLLGSAPWNAERVAEADADPPADARAIRLNYRQSARGEWEVCLRITVPGLGEMFFMTDVPRLKRSLSIYAFPKSFRGFVAETGRTWEELRKLILDHAPDA